MAKFRHDLEALMLGALTAGPLHGYAIAKAISSLADGTLRLREGQLYPVLHKLEAEGRVTAEWVQQTGKPARKVYRLTEDGRAELARRRKAWQKFTDAVGVLLAPRRPKEVRNG